MNSSQHKRMLAISERGIGDALTLTPVLAELKRSHPEIEIDFLAPSLRALAANFRHLANFIDDDMIEGKSRQEQISWLKQQNYEWVWNTQNQKSPWRGALEEAGNPNWISALPHRKWPKRQVVQLRLQQLRKLFPNLNSVNDPTIELTEEQRQEQADFLEHLANYQTSIAIQPWGKDPNKIWSVDKYREVMLRLTSRPSACVVLFLSPEEEQLFGTDYLPHQPNLIRICEPLSAALPKLAACNVFIGNDSGFYHLAHALGLRAVGIYRTWGSRMIWSYRTNRSRGLSFYLPRLLRKYWRNFISVRQVLAAADSLTKADSRN